MTLDSLAQRHTLPQQARLQIRYDTAAGPGTLAMFCFGNAPVSPAGGLMVETRLKPILPAQAAIVEQLATHEAARRGERGTVRYAASEHYLIAQIELEEAAYPGISAMARHAYEVVLAFNAESGYPHVLRMWNYIDCINDGAGDTERYRQFCVGRAAACSIMAAEAFPAASTLGRKQPTGQLQVFWLAARRPARRVENPRQISAYHYPRDYGPCAPSFARACLLEGGPLFISGTASIVGHASLHPDNIDAQLHETLDNIEALIAHARQWAPLLATQPDRDSLLKIYVRRSGDATRIEAELRRRYADPPAMLFLEADICRRELLLEIDCVHGIGPAPMNPVLP